MDLDLVVVYRAPSALMGNTIRDLLRQSNIPAEIENQQTNTYRGGSARYPLGGIGSWGDVVVERHRADEAVKLISGFLKASQELPPLSDAELEAQALAAADPNEEP